MTIDSSDEATATGLQQLVDRYVALWNEPDPDVRRHAIRALWAPDGASSAPTAHDDPGAEGIASAASTRVTEPVSTDAGRGGRSGPA